MRAAVFRGAGKPLSIDEVPDPTPGEGQVLVKIGRCGVCGTDLHMTSEHSHDLPVGSQLGHEYAGEIVEVGARPDGRLRVGDRVAVMPVAGCGRCLACLDKKPMRCANGKPQVVGFAEYAAVGASSARKLPASLSLADGALVEPLSVGLHGVIMAGIGPMSRVLVIGAGSVGLAAVFWSRKLGAGKIAVANRSQRRADLVKAMGADSFVLLGEGEADRAAEALGGPPNVILECVGAAGILEKSIHLAGVGATIVSLGFCTAPESILSSYANFKEVTLKFSFTYSLSEFEHSADTLDRGLVEPRMMISETVSLDAFPAMLEELRKGAPQTKVMVDPWMKTGGGK